MDANQLTEFEAAHQALDEALYPLTVTIGDVELACAGTITSEGDPELVKGGFVRDFGAEFSVSKAAWDEAELAAPEIGLLVEINGLVLRVVQVFGHQAIEPDWSVRCERRA